METVADQLVTPWGIEFLPDGRLLVSAATGVCCGVLRREALEPVKNPLLGTGKTEAISISRFTPITPTTGGSI